jgi:hypothetical protein
MPATEPQRGHFSRVCRDFETSRLEGAFLASAYERAVPTVSRRPRGKPTLASVAEQTHVTPAETEFPPKRVMERKAG